MICDVCGKRRMVGHKISHSNIKTKKRQYGNVQSVRTMVNGGVKRMHVCTRCLRSGKVVKAA